MSKMSESEYGKIELGDEVLLSSPCISRFRHQILRTTIIKPDGRTYEECWYCEYYFLKNEKSNHKSPMLCSKSKEIIRLSVR